jgi:hypothetical protein
MALKIAETATSIRIIVYLSIVIFQLYILNLAGESITRQTNDIINKLYDTNWYEFSLKTKKDLYVMLLKASKPVYRLAGRFYALHFENFTNVIKTSFSYFSIFRLVFEA